MLSYRSNIIKTRKNFCEIEDCIAINFMNEKRICRFSETVAFCYSSVEIEELYEEFRKMLSTNCPELENSEIRLCVLPLDMNKLPKLQNVGNEYIGPVYFPW